MQLLIGEGIDLHAHRFELETGDFRVDFMGNRIDFLLELIRVLRHILS